MNVALLKKIAERIVEHPKFYDQDNWCEPGWVKGTGGGGRYGCGTTACISGEACIVTGRVRVRGGEMILGEDFDDFETEGQAALSLTKEEAQRLFFRENWPLTFNLRYMEARDKLDYAGAACVAAERIAHFIKTKGRE